MQISAEVIPLQRDGLESSPLNTLPSFQQLITEYNARKKPILYPKGRVINFPDKPKEMTHYNPTGLPGCIFTRVELSYPYTEVSSVDQWEQKREGLRPTDVVIRNAQDPAVFQVGPNSNVLQVVRIYPSPIDKTSIDFHHVRLFPLDPNSGVCTDTSVDGPINQKDYRFAYVGKGLNVAVGRNRFEDDNGKVDSSLQVMFFPVPNAFEKFGDSLTQVHDTQYTIPVMCHDEEIWFGPNQITVLKSTDPRFRNIGVLFHIGKWETDNLHGNKYRRRRYVSAVGEFRYDMMTGRTYLTRRIKIIATGDDILEDRDPVTPKRPDLAGVFFGGNFLYYCHHGNLRTDLWGGYKDSATVVIRDIEYPFSLPPDPKHNRLIMTEK